MHLCNGLLSDLHADTNGKLRPKDNASVKRPVRKKQVTKITTGVHISKNLQLQNICILIFFFYFLHVNLQCSQTERGEMGVR